MFILPPNCIVPSATLLTMSPVFPSFLYLISPHSFDSPRSNSCFSLQGILIAIPGSIGVHCFSSSYSRHASASSSSLFLAIHIFETKVPLPRAYFDSGVLISTHPVHH